MCFKKHNKFRFRSFIFTFTIIIVHFSNLKGDFTEFLPVSCVSCLAILYLNGIKPSSVFPILKYFSASREMIMSSEGFPEEQVDQEYNLTEQAMTSELKKFFFC